VETLDEREDRIRRLEEGRVGRLAQVHTSGLNPPDYIGTGYSSVAPGRGNLAYSSQNVPVIPLALPLIGGRSISFTRIFQTQPWVAAAVMRLLTWAIRVPLRAYRTSEDPNDRDEIKPGEHPLADMVLHPWDRANQAQLVMNLLGPILIHGNSVTVMDDTANSGAIELTPKDWRFAQPIMPWRDSLEGFRCDVDTPDMAQDFSIDKILHVAYWSPTGPIGTSPLQQLGTTLAIEDAAQRYQRSVFQQGGRPPSAVTATEAFLGIKPEERREIMAQLRKDITELYGGPENMSKPALLPPGLDWKAIGGTAVEAALIDQRKISREEIAAVYLIPPPMIGILDRATFSNIATQRDMVYTDCLGPPLILIEQALNTQLIHELLQIDDVFYEFDFSAVLRGDRVMEINALRAAIGTALFSPNEGRKYLGQPTIDAPLMDDYYIPSNNLTPISTLTADDLKPKNKGADVPKPPGAPIPPPTGPPPPPPKPPPAGALHVVERGREYVLTPA